MTFRASPDWPNNDQIDMVLLFEIDGVRYHAHVENMPILMIF